MEEVEGEKEEEGEEKGDEEIKSENLKREREKDVKPESKRIKLER